MAHLFRSIAVFSAVIIGAGVFTASSLSTTASMVKVAAVNAPSAAKPIKPSYVSRLPEARADVLNVAKSVPVKPKAMPVAPAPVVAELTVEAAPSYTHQVAVSGANVRTGPKKSYPQVFTLREGSWVNVSDNVRGWVKVTDEDGREGWVYGDLLQAASTTIVAIN